jgi:hypothetical protein
VRVILFSPASCSPERGTISSAWSSRSIESYDATLWDCTAVMCRRLLETSIIEVYEKLGRAPEFKGRDGNFSSGPEMRER